jgi:delta 1-pyrroline-5-carboxylate dehydrogenase
MFRAKALRLKNYKMSSSSANYISRLARAEIPYLKNYKAYIGGKWKSAASNTTFPVFNPASGEKLAEVSNSGQADVKEAVLEAAQAFQSWKLKTAKVFVICYYCQIIRI